MNYPAPSALLNPLTFRQSGSISKVRHLCSAWGQVQMEVSEEGSIPPSPSSSRVTWQQWVPWRWWAGSHPVYVPSAQSGFIHIPAVATERISYPGLKGKTTGSTFIPLFLCNQVILLHGEGERRRKKRKCFLLISRLTATATLGACNSQFHTRC